MTAKRMDCTRAGRETGFLILEDLRLLTFYYSPTLPQVTLDSTIVNK
jgi:hypothetical protein